MELKHPIEIRLDGTLVAIVSEKGVDIYSSTLLRYDDRIRFEIIELILNLLGRNREKDRPSSNA